MFDFKENITKPTLGHMKLVMGTIQEHLFYEKNNLVTRQTERTLTFFQHYITTHFVWNVAEKLLSS
jgi:hypothetical protein